MQIRIISLTLLLLTFATSATFGQRMSGLIPDLFKSGSKTRTAFEDVVKQANKSTVKIYVDKKHVALGAVVDKNGYVLTKASELTGDVSVKTSDGKSYPAKVVGVQNTHDLAMLKIERKNLSPVKWSGQKRATVGEWVATSGWGNKPVSVGVVSTPRRSIPKRPGALGIRAKMVESKGRQEFAPGATIGEVYKNSAAAEAGLKIDDIITHVDGKAVSEFPALAQIVRKHGPGDVLKLRVKRGAKSFDVNVELSTMSVLPMMQSSRGAIQNRMGGKLSNRRYGFPAVFQHDTVLKPEDCGGPIVNLKGESLGINIARSGRVESFAVPYEVIKPFLNDLKSGKLAPPKDLATLKPVKVQPKKPVKPATPVKKEKKASDEKKPVKNATDQKKGDKKSDE